MSEECCVGIVGLGIYLPQSRMSAEEISRETGNRWSADAIKNKLGIIQKTIAGEYPQNGTQEMGALAALDCLKNTGVDPKEIDAVVYFGEEWKEYPLTTSACYVQDRIDAVNAWAVDLQNRCCTGVTAMKMAKDMLVADEECKTVMVCGGYRNCDLIDYTDNDMSMMYNLGAGGGALILKKNYTRNLLLGSHIISDGTLARTAGVEVGGLCDPVTPDNIASYSKLRLLEPKKMKDRLNKVSMNNWMRCIDEAFRKSGIDRSKLEYLSILHMKRSGHAEMLKNLGLTDDQTIYLENYGHVGQIDQILSLKLALDQGKVKDGTVLSMIAAGIGYVWAANVIRWGENA